MKWTALFIVGLLITVTPLIAQQIPAGTTLPIVLTSSIDAAKAKPGQQITGKVMQTINLSSGVRIPAGAKVTGHVVGANAATNSSPARLSFVMDTIRVDDHPYAVTTNLRAMAGFTQVLDAQTPLTGPDEGVTNADWTTEQVGGDENVYRDEGKVEAAGDRVVGSATANGILAAPETVPGMKCRGDFNHSGDQQAFWIFSSDACGSYGFDGLQISHAGRTNPVGQIDLASRKDIKLAEGTGLLLRVDGPSQRD